VVAYRRLFARDTQMAMRAVAGDVAPSLTSLDPTVPAGLDAIVSRALAKDASERFPDILELRRGVLEVLREAGIVDPKVGLAKLASEAFEREAAERTELIRRSRGAASAAVTGTELADEEGTPSKVRTATASTAPAPDAAKTAPSRRVLVAFSLVTLLVLVAVGILSIAAGSTEPVGGVAVPEPPTSIAVRPPPLEPPPTAQALATPASVQVTLESEPPGALVTIDEVARGTTPLVLELPQGETIQRATFEIAGRRAVTLSFLADRDQTLHAPLPRAGRGSAQTMERSASMATTMEGGGFYAFE
jgi:hypothetical protein